MVESRYQIETSSHRCGLCEREIACGVHYYSAVVFGGEVFARKDFCERCWLRARGGPGPAEGGSGRLDAQSAAGSSAGRGEGEPVERGAPEEYYAFWRTRRPEEAAVAAPRVRFDADLVLSFFRRLGGDGGADAGAAPQDDAPAGEDGAASADDGEAAERARKLFPIQRRNLRFVLALLLIRKKRLVLESSASDNGREWLRLSERESPGRVHWVENPELADRELERVRDDIGELLRMAV